MHKQGIRYNQGSTTEHTRWHFPHFTPHLPSARGADCHDDAPRPSSAIDRQKHSSACNDTLRHQPICLMREL